MKIPSKREKGCTRSERKEIESETAVEWRWQRGTEPAQEAGGGGTETQTQTENFRGREKKKAREGDKSAGGH